MREEGDYTEYYVPSDKGKDSRMKLSGRKPESGKSRRSRSRSGRAVEKDSGTGELVLMTAIWLAVLLIFMGIGIGIGWFLWGKEEKKADIDLKAIEAPSWIEQDFIRKNIYSRPAVSLEEVNGIVIHYVANPGTTAKNNRDYFDSLADQTGDGTSVSSHFIVGLEGEIVQAVPISEMAYATKGRNDDTISIESCHPDDTGRYEQATYDSMVKLTAWLCRELNLDPKKDVIRHYDEGGKVCPKYFVENEDAWKQFLEDVKNAM